MNDERRRAPPAECREQRHSAGQSGQVLQKVIPDGAPPFTFTGDWAPDAEYRCWGFDRPWNGWDTPIVDRETLEAVLAGAEETVIWSGDVAARTSEQVKPAPAAKPAPDAKPAPAPPAKPAASSAKPAPAAKPSAPAKPSAAPAGPRG